MYGLIYATSDCQLGMFEGFQSLADATMNLVINILLYLGYDVIIVKETISCP